MLSYHVVSKAPRVLHDDPPGDQAVLEQLRRITESHPFAGSNRMRRFVSFAVTETLAGRLHALKEYTIGIQVFDRSSDFDPAYDPIVRVEARRLREKLDTYYRTDGRTDAVIIELPKGGYAARFRTRGNSPAIVARVAIDMFTPLSAAAQPICEGLRFELVDQLSRVHGIVVSASTVHPVNSGNILTGCVQVRGDRVRVIAHSLDAMTNECRWSAAIEEPMSDAVHEVLATQIAAMVITKCQL
jgi:TolB-like protein